MSVLPHSVDAVWRNSSGDLKYASKHGNNVIVGSLDDHSLKRGSGNLTSLATFDYPCNYMAVGVNGFACAGYRLRWGVGLHRMYALWPGCLSTGVHHAGMP